MLGRILVFVVIIAQVSTKMKMRKPEYTWHAAEDNIIPCDSPLPAGWGDECHDIYIGRAWYEENLLPAKVMPVYGIAFVGLNGKEYWNRTYEVLCGDYASWVSQRDGRSPKQALAVGTTSEGDVLYYGRSQIAQGLHPGKVSLRYKGILIPLNGSEYFYSHYEVLVK